MKTLAAGLVVFAGVYLIALPLEYKHKVNCYND